MQTLSKEIIRVLLMASFKAFLHSQYFYLSTISNVRLIDTYQCVMFSDGKKMGLEFIWLCERQINILTVLMQA